MSTQASHQLATASEPLPVESLPSPAPPASHVLMALGGLIYVDVMLRTRGYVFLRRRLLTKNTSSRRAIADPAGQQTETLAAVDRAAMMYPRRAMCLQRSAVATWLLRRRGIAANMVIGCRHTPFYAHAWVEVDRVVVNDTPRVRELYPEMERL